jgi:cell division protein FtsZ
MTLNLRVPENIILKPCITVFGVGGAGGNAVNNMISANLEGARFVVANTDAQALEYSLAERKIQLGENVTRGLGAGASPDVGRASADEAMEQIMDNLVGSNMVFITAGMGGGTGTGAAPVIAKAAKESGILTVGVVTKPFHFEGAHRMKIAELGLSELQKYVDTLIVIPNQNLFRLANEKTTFSDAFKLADDVLHAGVRGVTDLMIMPGLINLDFADIRAVMSEMGKAMMGTGEAEGDRRAVIAAEAAISNPLLDNCSMKGARGVLINITGGPDMTLFEVDEAANRIRDEVDQNANIIFGSTFNPDLEGKIRVSVVATGIEAEAHTTRSSYAANSINNYSSSINKPLTTDSFVNQSRANLHEEIASAKDSYLAEDLDIDTSEHEIKERNNFMSKLQQTNFHAENYDKSATEQLYNINQNLDEESQHRYSINTSMDKKEHARKPVSLLDRMAYSMGLKSYDTTNDRSVGQFNKAKQEKVLSEANVGIDIAEDDILDIPAFLRRKK